MSSSWLLEVWRLATLEARLVVTTVGQCSSDWQTGGGAGSQYLTETEEDALQSVHSIGPQETFRRVLRQQSSSPHESHPVAEKKSINRGLVLQVNRLGNLIFFS